MDIVTKITQKLLDKSNKNNIIEIKIRLDSSKLFATIMSQQIKGINKYGQSIDDCPCSKYNWTNMMYEEIADYLVYEEKLKQCNKTQSK